MNNKIESLKKAIRYFHSVRFGIMDDGESFIGLYGITNVNLAIDALEKHIPKKPIAFERTAHDFSTGYCSHSHSQCEHIKCYNHEYKYTDYKCPICDVLTKDGTPNYCWSCGQALDWSDV